MLKRRSIRTKLMVALALMSAIVILLAFSGIWGLYRYRQLATAVDRQAKQFPHATKINRLAFELSLRNERISDLQSRQLGMMEYSNFGGSVGDPLINVERFEQDQFVQTAEAFERALDSYRRILELRYNDDSSLVGARQRRSLGVIRETCDSLNLFIDRLQPLDFQRDSELQGRLNSIVDQTSDHLTMVIHGTSALSEDVRGKYKAWVWIAWGCAILALAMVGILLAAFRSLVVKPFRTLVVGSRLVAGGQFDHRIDLGTGDELDELAIAMNAMTDRFQDALGKLNTWCSDLDEQVQQRTREVIQNEQLASVGFLAAGVAHEINNPLATIAFSAESLVSRVAEQVMLPAEKRIVDDELCDALRTNLHRIEEEAFRCKGITEKLLDFSRLSEVQRAPTDLSQLADDVVNMVGKVGKFKCKTINIEAPSPVIAEVDPQEIRQVLLNLVTNALESVDTDGAVDVRVENAGQFAAIVVADNGCGMSAEVLQHLFEPFFTRRQDGTGTGLGLSITYRIVSQHGGSLCATSDGEGRGSRMEMTIPLKANNDDVLGTVRTSMGLDHQKYQSAA